MWAGEHVVALVWSFTDALAEIPYRISYESKKYSCNCPQFTFRRTCKHVATFRSAAKDGTLANDKRYNITDYGRKIISK